MESESARALVCSMVKSASGARGFPFQLFLITSPPELVRRKLSSAILRSPERTFKPQSPTRLTSPASASYRWHPQCSVVHFKIDENLPIDVAEILRSSGHNAVTVIDQRMKGAADSTLIAACE